MTDILDTVKAALVTSTPGPWALDERFGLDVVHADDVGQPHGGGATPELDARYCWVIANVRADKPFDGCEKFNRRRFAGQAQPLADAHLIANAPTWLRALVTRCEQAEAENARMREQTCATCRHQVTQFRPDDPTCGLTRRTDGVHVVVTSVPCRFLGHGCRAWAALEGDHDQ